MNNYYILCQSWYCYCLLWGFSPECSKLKAKVVGLERALEEKVHDLEKMKEELGSSQQEKYHQLTKAHARAQKLQTEITGIPGLFIVQR